MYIGSIQNKEKEKKEITHISRERLVLDRARSRLLSASQMLHMRWNIFLHLSENIIVED